MFEADLSNPLFMLYVMNCEGEIDDELNIITPDDEEDDEVSDD